MKLSIIVPVYNMAADNKLHFCMDSLLAQTISDYEIIAVDNGSTDTSMEILRTYEKNHPEIIRVIACPTNTSRQGGAKNEGLKVATGEWIGFIDSDDWITPDYYEKLITKAEETGADLVGCDYSLVYEHTFEVGKVVVNNTEDQTGVLDEEKHKKLMLSPGSMVLKVYKHSVIKENNLSFPEGMFYEDNCAGPLWSLYFTHFERVPEPMYFYYQHNTSTVHSITEDHCRDRIRAKKLFYEECKNRGFLETYEQEIEYRMARFSYLTTLFSYMQGVRHPRMRFVKEARESVAEYFPAFEENPYYQSEVDEAEKELASMQGKSDLLFYWYYRLQLLVRRLRSR